MRIFKKLQIGKVFRCQKHETKSSGKMSMLFRNQKFSSKNQLIKLRGFLKIRLLFKIKPLKSKMIFHMVNLMFTNQLEHHLFKYKQMRILLKTNVQGILFQIIQMKAFPRTNFKETLFNIINKEISINFKVKEVFDKDKIISNEHRLVITNIFKISVNTFQNHRFKK